MEFKEGDRVFVKRGGRRYPRTGDDFKDINDTGVILKTWEIGNLKGAYIRFDNWRGGIGKDCAEYSVESPEIFYKEIRVKTLLNKLDEANSEFSQRISQ